MPYRVLNVRELSSNVNEFQSELNALEASGYSIAGIIQPAAGFASETYGEDPQPALIILRRASTVEELMAAAEKDSFGILHAGS